jgi:hypothetical protein
VRMVRLSAKQLNRVHGVRPQLKRRTKSPGRM